MSTTFQREMHISSNGQRNDQATDSCQFQTFSFEQLEKSLTGLRQSSPRRVAFIQLRISWVQTQQTTSTISGLNSGYIAAKHKFAWRQHTGLLLGPNYLRLLQSDNFSIFWEHSLLGLLSQGLAPPAGLKAISVWAESVTHHLIITRQQVELSIIGGSLTVLEQSSALTKWRVEYVPL